MTESIDNLMIRNIECANNIAFILFDSDNFSKSEFTLLEDPELKNCFLKCCKTLYNGKIELIYFAEDYLPLSEASKSFNAENFLVLFDNLTGVINKLENRDMNCEKLFISADTVYVCKSDMSVRLVYLPMVKNCYSDRSEFLRVLRKTFHYAISSNPNLSEELYDFDSALVNEGIDISLISKHYPADTCEIETECPTEDKKILKLTSLNSPENLSITMNKDTFIIGRNANYADGVVAFNKYIGKKHCMLLRENNSFSIVDLGSTNKTYVNGVELTPNVPVDIVNGDTVRLANTDFKVSIT